jgi:hypothetical protein
MTIKAFALTLILASTATLAQASSLARFAPSLAALKGLAQESAQTAPGDVQSLRKLMIQKDGRKWLFRIEGLVRLYRTTEAETAKPLLRKIKELEDGVGDHTAAVDFANYGRSVPVEPALQAVLDAEVARTAVDMDALLTTWFLQPRPYIDLYTLGLSQLRERTDRELIEAFKTEVRGVKELDFDLNLLEDGVHELRRQVRWLNIYAEGLGDLFNVTVDASIPDDFRRLESSGRPGESIRIEKSFTRKLSVFLTGIGKLKDQGEPVEALVIAAKKAGLVQDHAQGEALVRTILVANNKIYPEITRPAQQIVADFDLQASLDQWLDVLDRYQEASPTLRMASSF